MHGEKNRKPRAKLSLLVFHLMTLIIVCTLCLQAFAGFDFDLNSDPADNMDIDTVPGANKPAGRPNREKLKAMYAKIEKLFQVLKVCDKDNFDISKLHIPTTFGPENKAMLALQTVSKSKLITKNEKLLKRYQRVMDNCRQLARAVREKDEAINGSDSQMSGQEYAALMERRKYELNNSPFEDIRTRFYRKLPPTAIDSEPLIVTTTTTTEKPQQSSLVADFSIQTMTDTNSQAPQLIQFL